MTLVLDALRGGERSASRAARPTRRATPVVVAGGAGTLGSAVLERLLAGGRFGPVQVLVSRGFTVGLAGLETVAVEPDFATGEAGAEGAAHGPPLADLGLVVFDRPRHANGRERAFVQPHPAQLPALAGWLRAHGVARLVVVLPHATATLPAALKHGLANLDEHAVAALGFDRLVVVRSAASPQDARAARWLQRVANGVLAQLRIMVAANQQPVRAPKVAAFVAELLARLPTGPGPTRVVPPELVWQAAQLADPGALVAAWFDGRELPPWPRLGRVFG